MFGLVLGLGSGDFRLLVVAVGMSTVDRPFPEGWFQVKTTTSYKTNPAAGGGTILGTPRGGGGNFPTLV